MATREVNEMMYIKCSAHCWLKEMPKPCSDHASYLHIILEKTFE